MYRDADGINRHPARGRRAGAVVAGLATLALIAAACGGGSKSPGVASVGATATTAEAPASSGSSGSSSSTTLARPLTPASTSSSSRATTTAPPSRSSGALSPSSESDQSQQLQFARCMRTHGVTEFPDPSAGGFLNAIAASGINTKSPAFQAALQACKKYTPEGNMTPAQSAAQTAKGLEFSQCMRSHGVPNFPDPSTGPAGEQVIDLRGLGIDPGSPTLQKASQACGRITGFAGK